MKFALHLLLSFLVIVAIVESKKRFTWQEFRNLRSSSVRGNWLQNGQIYIYKKSDELYAYDSESGKSYLYYQSELLGKAADWQISSSGFNLLIATDPVYGYTHYVNTYTYTIIEINTEKVLFTGSGFQKFKFSPKADLGGDGGEMAALVKDFDIHVFDFKDQSLTQITFDGEENVIFNGITDWLHAVEITDDDCLVFWAPDGKSIVYGQLDQHGVSNFEYNVFLGSERTYPKRIVLPYPKPGTKLPQMNLFYVNTSRVGDASFKKINQDNFKEMRLDLEASEEVQNWQVKSEEEWGINGYYLNMARWVDNDVFQATFKNRSENVAINDHVSMSWCEVLMNAVHTFFLQKMIIFQILVLCFKWSFQLLSQIRPSPAK